MASIYNPGAMGSHLTSLFAGQEKRNWEIIKGERDERMGQILQDEEFKRGQWGKLAGPVAGVLGGAGGGGLMSMLGGLGGGGSPLSAMGGDSFGQQASRNIPGGFGNPSYGSGMGGPVWQNPSSGTNWNYMTGQQNLPY